MQARFNDWLTRLEAMTLRERVLLLAGLPLLLVVVGEVAVFGPARARAAAADQQARLQQAEIQALSAALAAAQPAAALPAPDQLLRQRNLLQEQIAAARSVMASVNRTVDWGTVVRSTVAGTPGLTLTQLRTTPAELVFSPAANAAARPAPGAAASAVAGAAAKPLATAAPVVLALGTAVVDPIYRHRAELTVHGNFAALLAYLQNLQRMPGDLRWERLHLTVADYPAANVQLTLHTLSSRAQTPFQ